MTAETKRNMVYQLLTYLGACFIPVLSGVLWLNSNIVTLKTQVEGMNGDLVNLKSDIEAVEALQNLTVTVEGLSRQVSKQWEIIGESRDEINRREEVIRSAKRDIDDMKVRLRRLEVKSE